MSESLIQNLIPLFWALRSNKSLINFSRSFEIVNKCLEKLERRDMKNPKFDLATEDFSDLSACPSFVFRQRGEYVEHFLYSNPLACVREVKR